MAEPFLDGDLLVAFGFSASLAHVRNGAVLEYIPLPASRISGIHSLTYFNSEFYFASSDGGGNDFFIYRIKADSTVEEVYTTPFGYITGAFQISFAGGVPWWGVGGTDLKSAIKFNSGSVWSVAAAYALLDGTQRRLNKGGEIRRTDGCSFIYATSLDSESSSASFRLWQYQICTDLSLGEIIAVPSTGGINGTRIRLNNTEILLARSTPGSLGASLIDFDGNVLHDYSIAGSPARVGTLDWDSDDLHFWAGQFPAFGQPADNLYRFDVAAETYLSYLISRAEGGSTQVSSLAVHNTNVPGPPSASAGFTHGAVLGI